MSLHVLITAELQGVTMIYLDGWPDSFSFEILGDNTVKIYYFDFFPISQGHILFKHSEKRISRFFEAFSLL